MIVLKILKKIEDFAREIRIETIEKNTNKVLKDLGADL